MSRRAAAALVIASAMGLAVVAVVTASFAGGSSPAEGDSRYRGSEPPAGIAMPEFALRNYDGRLIRSGELRGRVTVLTFLDSQCAESCPVIAWTVARVLDTLTPAERDDVEAVAISTDPAEDTTASVRGFLARNRATGRLWYVGGGEPEHELRKVWNAFYVLSSLESGRDTLHSAPVRIYDRTGTWAATLHAGADLTEANLAHDIRVALGA
ncbi:MAG TPA: SCO family protein [Gaiellaceae bacterium]|nr:SCO family protein [Gaiellaceae bacterium]